MTPAGWPRSPLGKIVRWLLAALVGFLLVLAGIVVGAVPAAAQNAVGASSPASANTVGPLAGIGAGQRLGKVVPQPQIVVATGVAAEDAGAVFRSDTGHIFRNASGHLTEDTAENRALIQGAIDPANLRSTIRLPDGSTLEKYFQDLPDGTQAWVEVRNGTEITNGGVNATPR